MRQNNQVELNLGTGATGEARSAAAQETEARAAQASGAITSKRQIWPQAVRICGLLYVREALSRVKGYL